MVGDLVPPDLFEGHCHAQKVPRPRAQSGACHQAADRLTREAAAMLGFDIQTIDGLISAKKLRASKPNRRVVIRVADLEAMLDASAV